jgi:hypothetical protein
MKKLFLCALAVVACGLSASAAQALCNVVGEISRVSVNPGGVQSSFYVRTSNPGSTSFLFNTIDIKIITAALSAQASHERVLVTGNATTCGAVVSGSSFGGSVNSITTAP